jgi:S1-C subfamily serine protease
MLEWAGPVGWHGGNSVPIIILFCFLLAFALPVHGQKQLSPKDIFDKNRAAIVLVQAGQSVGSGFIVSSDGLIFTAHHVVAQQDNNGQWSYSGNLKVRMSSGSILNATAVGTPTSASVNFDFAILKIDGQNLAHVEIGSWNEVAEGDSLTLLPSGGIPLLLTGIVSARLQMDTALGPEKVNTLLYQSPVRKGFSGGAVFNDSTGHVVGIINTRLVGISPALDDARKQITRGASMGKVRILGVDPNATTLELINVLDQTLISGLGSAVAIDYASAAMPSHHTK